MGKGSNTSTNATSSSADPQAAQAYRDLLVRAQGVAATPYQAYSGELTAPVNSQQNLGISGINANAGFASPYIQQASTQAASASSPLTGGQIQSYLNPYTQSVVDATTAQMMHDNQQQNAQLTGNQISQGALGGNATGVARGILAGQQNRTLASTTADLYSKGYGQALQTAQAQQQLGLAGANAQANYGISGQNALLAGAGQQINAGSLQQQNEQARLDALYKQYTQAQAFPYQQTQWLAGVDTGVGSNLGGVSSGSTTGPAPNQTAQWLGAGLSAAALLSDREAKDHIEHIGKMHDGTPIYRFKYKGDDQWHVGPMAQDVEKKNPDAVERGLSGLRYIDLEAATDDSVRRAGGGGVGGVPTQPWSEGLGWIPQMNIHGGAGAPHASAPSLQNQQSSFDPSKLASGISALKGKGSGLGLDWGGMLASGGNLSGEAWGGGSFAGGDAYGGSSAHPIEGLDASDYGEGFARGGGIAGYAGGGAPNRYVNGIPFADSQDEAQGMFGEGEDVSPGMSFEDRAAPVRQAIAAGDFDPSGINSTDFHGSPGMEASNRGVAPTPMARPEGAGAPVVASDDEEEEAPAGVAARPRASAAPPVMAQGYDNLPDAIRPQSDERSGLGVLPISRNAGTGLLAAGLGMMASRSPFLGNAIGDGGLAGVAAYGAANEADRKTATEAAKLSQEARKQNIADALGNRKQTETERHNRASEKDTKAGRAPMGMQFNKNGELEDIPGWTKTLEKAAKARKGPEGDVMDDDTAQFMADRIIAGDTKVLTGLGRGAQGAANIMKVQRLVARRAASGEPISQAAREILNNAAQFEGLKTAERTQAAIMSKLSVYGRTAFNATDLAVELSKAVPRTEFQPVNKIINAAKTKVGDPKIVALGQALQTLSNEYARAIGGGHGTVHMQEQAEKRLSEAQTQDQLEAVINVMRREILAEERAMPAARQHIRDIYNPNPNGARGKSIAGEHGAAPPPGPVGGASGLQEGRTGTKGGRPVVVKGGKLIYSDTGEAAQ